MEMLDDDDEPINPDEEDPELEEILLKVQQGMPVEEVPATDSYASEEDAEDRRRSELLMAFLAAGGQLPELIEQFLGDIDEPLLQLLEGRIRTAAEVGEPPDSIEEMQDLLRALRRAQQRAAAPPALRLLDDLLAILGEAVPGDPLYAPRRLEAQARMQEAFTGQAVGVDIFQAAAALADEGRATAGQMLTTEMVFLPEFMSEALNLLQEAEEKQRQLADAIRRGAEAVRAARATGDPSSAGVSVEELEAGKAVLLRRKRTLQQVEDLVLLARQMEGEASPAKALRQQQNQRGGPL